MKRVVILISGRGSNMEAILSANTGAQVVAVISNRPDALGLESAAAHGIFTACVDHKQFASRESFDAALAAEIEQFAPDWIVLAGFMRILTPAFISRFSWRIINIHPSLLPSYPGLNTHARALADGVKIHGCTVHVVTPLLDHGPILAQAAVAVEEGDDEAALSARVLAQEHRIYPAVIAALCTEKIQIESDGRVRVHLDVSERVGSTPPTSLMSPPL